MAKLVNYFSNFSAPDIRANDTYRVQDWEILNNLTISRTCLWGGKSTKGHAHPGLEEVYVFTGSVGERGEMEVGTDRFEVHPGMIVAVPAGEFHRVHNKDDKRPLQFIAIFQKYDRNNPPV